MAKRLVQIVTTLFGRINRPEADVSYNNNIKSRCFTKHLTVPTFRGRGVAGTVAV